MKLDIQKLLRILGHLIVAAPAIAAAVKPVVDEVSRPRVIGS